MNGINYDVLNWNSLSDLKNCMQTLENLNLVKKAVNFRKREIIRILNTHKNGIFPVTFKVMHISLRYT